AATCVTESLDGLDETVERRQQQAVLDVLPGLPGEARVDRRRAAVRDRVADDRVAIGHRRSGSGGRADAVSSESLVNVQVRTICRMSPSRAISGVKRSYGAPA